MSLPEDNVVAECSNCGLRGAHRRTHVANTIHHLRCESCGTINPYSVTPVDGKSSPRIVGLDSEALTAGPDAPEARTYRATEPFFEGMLISHPTFGIGYVLAVLSPAKKMEVLFSDKRRVLVCGPGSGTIKPVATEREKREPSRPKSRRRHTRTNQPSDARTEPAKPSDAPVRCPSCGHSVHPFNILHTPGARPNRCMHCG